MSRYRIVKDGNGQYQVQQRFGVWPFRIWHTIRSILTPSGRAIYSDEYDAMKKLQQIMNDDRTRQRRKMIVEVTVEYTPLPTAPKTIEDNINQRSQQEK